MKLFAVKNVLIEIHTHTHMEEHKYIHKVTDKYTHIYIIINIHKHINTFT